MFFGVRDGVAKIPPSSSTAGKVTRGEVCAWLCGWDESGHLSSPSLSRCVQHAARVAARARCECVGRRKKGGNGKGFDDAGHSCGGASCLRVRPIGRAMTVEFRRCCGWCRSSKGATEGAPGTLVHWGAPGPLGADAGKHRVAPETGTSPQRDAAVRFWMFRHTSFVTR